MLALGYPPTADLALIMRHVASRIAVLIHDWDSSPRSGKSSMLASCLMPILNVNKSQVVKTAYIHINRAIVMCLSPYPRVLVVVVVVEACQWL